MSNIMGMVLGGLLVILGLVLLTTWFSMFVKALMAVVPIVFILVGAGLLAYFISEVKSKIDVAPPEEKKVEQK